MRTFALSVFTAVLLIVPSLALAADPDTTPPKATDLKLSNKIFKVGTKNTALITRAKKKKAPTGTTIKFVLEENSYVAIAVFKAVKGKTVGSQCVKPTEELKKAKDCVRPSYIKTMQRIGKPGPNAIPFSGKLDGDTLKPGAYGFGIIFSDVLGNQSKLATRSFTIVKG
jgi:ubiquitin